MSRSNYWLCWAGVAITFALLAFWPNIGLGIGNTAMILLTGIMPLAVPVLWALRLRNAGRPAWWVLPIGMGLIAVSMTACDRLAGGAGYDPEQALHNAVFPELVLIVGLAFLAITLIIGLLPAKSVAITES